MMTWLGDVESEAAPQPVAGEIYICSLDKDRPAIVLPAGFERPALQNQCWIVPVTTSQNPAAGRLFELLPGEGGLKERSWAKLDHERAISIYSLKNRLPREMSAERMRQLLLASTDFFPRRL